MTKSDPHVQRLAGVMAGSLISGRLQHCGVGEEWVLLNVSTIRGKPGPDPLRRQQLRGAADVSIAGSCSRTPPFTKICHVQLHRENSRMTYYLKAQLRGLEAAAVGNVTDTTNGSIRIPSVPAGQGCTCCLRSAGTPIFCTRPQQQQQTRVSDLHPGLTDASHNGILDQLHSTLQFAGPIVSACV